jgi:hypothetical protein
VTITHQVEALAHGLLGPLVLGGPARLVPPIGAKAALAVPEGTRIVDDDLRTKVDVARVRLARTLVPLDTLPDMPSSEWTLVAALNDLLQATNHMLSGPFTRGRHEVLIASVENLVSAVLPPRTLLEAVSRHATFARIGELVRTDTKVSWWTGSARFRGEKPPQRLYSWKELRRVRTDENTVGLADLPDGTPALSKDHWQTTLAHWLTRSPLTDIAWLTRTTPVFSWSKEALAFVATPMGSKLAARALASRATGEGGDVAKSLEASINKMPAGDARNIALGFATEVVSRVKGGAPARGSHRAST